MSPSQGLHLHGTAQHKKNADIYPCLERDFEHDPSVQAVKDRTCLRSSGHWDRPVTRLNPSKCTPAAYTISLYWT